MLLFIIVLPGTNVGGQDVGDSFPLGAVVGGVAGGVVLVVVVVFVLYRVTQSKPVYQVESMNAPQWHDTSKKPPAVSLVSINRAQSKVKVTEGEVYPVDQPTSHPEQSEEATWEDEWGAASVAEAAAPATNPGGWKGESLDQSELQFLEEMDKTYEKMKRRNYDMMTVASNQDMKKAEYSKIMKKAPSAPVIYGAVKKDNKDNKDNSVVC